MYMIMVTRTAFETLKIRRGTLCGRPNHPAQPTVDAQIYTWHVQLLYLSVLVHIYDHGHACPQRGILYGRPNHPAQPTVEVQI